VSRSATVRADGTRCDGSSWRVLSSIADKTSNGDIVLSNNIASCSPSTTPRRRPFTLPLGLVEAVESRDLFTAADTHGSMCTR